jgi:diguanylate cyclase (GGDEF)-like protein
VCLVGGPLLVWLLWWLRHLPNPGDPLFFGYLEVVGGVVALGCAANALVGFRGTHERAALIVAVGFLLAGLLEVGDSFAFFSMPAGSSAARIPLVWMLGQAVLASMLLAAALADKRVRAAGDPNREIAVVLLVVGGVTYLAASLSALAEPASLAGELVPRPWHLVPAALFLLAAIGFRRRLQRTNSAFDRAICYAAVLGAGCHLLASQSESLLGAPFALAEIVKVSSYAVLFGGALLDSGRLLEQVRQMATSDPLTGLANYRRLLDALDLEIKRSQRSGRPFALLLFDLDGLKRINDSQGHLVGSKVLIRLANVLRVYCRETDTSARYGGDEFALVLPEVGELAARQVADRVQERLASDGERPLISVSAGLAIYPRDGGTIEKLLSAADRALYAMKERSRFPAAVRASAG